MYTCVSPPKLRLLVASGPAPRLKSQGSESTAVVDAAVPSSEFQQDQRSSSQHPDDGSNEFAATSTKDDAGAEEAAHEEEEETGQDAAVSPTAASKSNDASCGSPPREKASTDEGKPSPPPRHRSTRLPPLPENAKVYSRSRSDSKRRSHGAALYSPSPQNPTPIRIAPKIAAYRVSGARSVEAKKSDKIFLRKKDRDDPDHWWQALAPKMTAFKPITNAIPDNTTRRVNTHHSDEDNIWQHLYESGQDAERKKLFSAGPESFIGMSKMWEGGFKTHGDAEKREVTVPTMTQLQGWDRTSRTDYGSANEPNSDQSQQQTRKTVVGFAEEDGYNTYGSTSNLSRASRPRRSISHEPRQANRSPWYQKSEQLAKTNSSKYLLSSSRHLNEDREGSSGGGRQGVSFYSGGDRSQASQRATGGGSQQSLRSESSVTSNNQRPLKQRNPQEQQQQSKEEKEEEKPRVVG